MRRIIFIGLALIMAATAVAQDGYALICDLGGGVEVRLRGKIVSEECWAGNRNVFERNAVRANRWKQHLYIAENSGDYLWTRFVIAPGTSLVLDATTYLVLVYEDGSRIVSKEMIFTNGSDERERFPTTEEIIVLTSNAERYGRSRDCNGYVAAVRFEREALPGGGKWGYDLPVSVEIHSVEISREE